MDTPTAPWRLAKAAALAKRPNLEPKGVCVFKRQRRDGTWSPVWQAQLTHAGQTSVVAINSPSVDPTDTEASYRAAVEWAVNELKFRALAREQGRWDLVRPKARATVTYRQLRAAWLALAIRRDIARPEKQWACFQRVVMVGMGLRAPCDGLRSDTGAGAAITEKFLDRTLELTATVKRSFQARYQQFEAFESEGLALHDGDAAAALAHARAAYARATPATQPNISRRSPPAVNRSINSDWEQACMVLSPKNRGEPEFEALHLDFKALEGFLLGGLPADQAELTLPAESAFAAYLAAVEFALTSSDPTQHELAVASLVFQLCLRTNEALAARAGWLLELADGRTLLDIRPRPAEGFRLKAGIGQLPLTQRLAQLIRERTAQARAAGIDNPHLIAPLLTPSARKQLVESKHNAFVKAHLGESAKGQGNHWLRSIYATTYYLHAESAQHGTGLHTAMDWLRHKEEATTIHHYIQKQTLHLKPLAHYTLEIASKAP